MSKEKKAVTLKEEDLAKVGGGRQVYLTPGTYNVQCPFLNCGSTFTFTAATGHTKGHVIPLGDTIGYCPGCGATIVAKTRTSITYTKDNQTIEVQIRD